MVSSTVPVVPYWGVTSPSHGRHLPHSSVVAGSRAPGKRDVRGGAAAAGQALHQQPGLLHVLSSPDTVQQREKSQLNTNGNENNTKIPVSCVCLVLCLVSMSVVCVSALPSFSGTCAFKSFTRYPAFEPFAPFIRIFHISLVMSLGKPTREGSVTTQIMGYSHKSVCRFQDLIPPL